ncbi:MAG: cell division protein ZapE, partial [Methylobacter sp.]
FHVTDIADAMILGRLFSKLFDLDTTVVITSNRHPNDLYQGGLQRELFLPFVKLLQETSEIIELAAKEDYRFSRLQALETTYYFPLDENAGEFVQQSYNKFTNFAPLQPGVLKVWGREIILAAVHGDVVLTSFDELCAQPLGSADYLEIASEFSTLIMAEIPRLNVEARNEAKRFVTLIDALYEHKVKLICTAAVPAQELYTQGDGAFEFERTVSRLIEMQSEGYLHTEHAGRS